jgi:hypothetical protein
VAFAEQPVVATLNGAVGIDTVIDATNGFVVNASNQALNDGDLVQIGFSQFAVKAGAALATKIVPLRQFTVSQAYQDKTPILLVAAKVAV